ncbi:MAG: hypothetical protein J7K36_04885 [Archaeoglobaceae archaeon]|nr:hypothetical protein [Archaeoglobaceae archaeon]
MDLSKLPNPYDFANPITDPHLFAGREKEMEEIRYYLDYASKSSRSINLAILGPRASGKTSVLNIIEHEAKEREFTVVRVDLDEGDVQTQLAFFYKIFDSVLTIACLQGAFEGINGKTYEIYRNMVDAYEVPEDKTFCPFIFPIQYAKAMSKGNINAPLSETNFKRDIKKIQEELGSPIILLLDECDVLTKSRVHLEKLRNIFMDVPNLMLVMTGTPALFPLMNEIFSPIIRQFKKIYLEPFKEEKDTKDCVRKPLEKIGIRHPSELFDFEAYHDVSEMHALSGGRPYEIQLLCHIMFRRVQEGRAKRMEITLNVLDEVRKELESFQDVPARPILTAIRDLDEEGLSALGVLCECSGYATFDQIWFAEFVFSGEKKWTKERLLKQFNLLREKQVISVRDDIITFAGDDFDRIYAKYFARKQGIPLSINEIPFEIYLVMRLNFFLMGKLKGIQPFSFPTVGEIRDLRVKEAAFMMKEDDRERNPFKIMPETAQEVYKLMTDFQGVDSCQVARIAVNSPWITVQQWYRWRSMETTKQHLISIIQSLLSEPKNRALTLGGDLDIEVYDLPVVPMEILAKKVENSENIKLKHELSTWHSIKMVNVYLKQHDIKKAILHGELAYRYHPQPHLLNNLSYLFMVSDNLTKARELLEKAIKDYKQPKDQALPIYNLGIVEAKEGKFESALDKFRLTISKIETAEKTERMCACLILPKIADKALVFEEVMEPDLLETAQSAITVLSQLLS